LLSKEDLCKAKVSSENVITEAAEKDESTSRKRTLTGSMLRVYRVLGVAFSVFSILALTVWLLDPLQMRSVHIAFAFCLGFMLYKAGSRSKSNRIPVYDWLFIALSIVTMVYIAYNATTLSRRLAYVDPVTTVQMIFGLIVIILICELTRRAVGLPLTVVAVIGILYALLGKYIPGDLGHAGIAFRRFIEFIYLGTNGLFGSTIGVSATYVIAFIVFGSFLEQNGTGEFLLRIGISAASGLKGGPAKSAVIASTVMGTTMGSAIANVYCTGQFTIPMMKRYGFKPKIAGAVESVSSTISQIMPPVMSSAAFIIADTLGKSYGEVCVAAIVPALLYGVAIYSMVHLESVKMGEPAETFKKEDIKKLVKRKWFLVLPIIALVYMLIRQYTAFYAALIATVVAVAVSFFSRETIMTPKKVLAALQTAAQRVVSMAVALAAASLVVSCVQVTGLAVKFTKVLISISGGNLLLMLIFIAIACIVLGMGLPTPAAYLLTALFAGPTLIQLGIDPMVAHMFIFNFAILSVITPPVAMAAYAGAEIAEANVNQTGWQAFRLGIAAYIIPFYYVFNPSLLLQGKLDLFAVITAVIGILALSMAVQGWYFNCLNAAARLIAAAAALMLFYSDLIVSLIGFLVLVGLGVFELRKKTGHIRLREGYRLLKGLEAAKTE